MNHIGWSNAEFDRLYSAFTIALDRAERNQLLVQMNNLLMEELPNHPLYFNFEVIAYAVGLRGPRARAPTTTDHWAVHEWTLR